MWISELITVSPDVHHTFTDHWVYKHECGAETGTLSSLLVYTIIPACLLEPFDMYDSLYITSTIASIERQARTLGARHSAPLVFLGRTNGTNRIVTGWIAHLPSSFTSK